MMNLSIKFSIAIPAYKGFYLKEAIESCLAQTYRNFEVIIVDDASPENLRGIVDAYLKDPHVRFYRNEKNCGAVDVVDNWNICLGYCTGDYVICMGDDDRLLPCCLDEYAKLIEKYSGIGIVHGWTEIIDENSSFLDIQQPRPEYEGALSVMWNRWNGRTKQYIGDWCFNVEKLRQDGGFYKLPMAWGSDDISAVRAARSGVANTQVLCFQYRQNRHTISNTGNMDVKMNATLKEFEWCIRFIDDMKHTVVDSMEHRYLLLLECDINRHFYEKFKKQMAADMRTDLFRVFHWISQRNKYNVSVGRVLSAYNMALQSRFHGK